MAYEYEIEQVHLGALSETEFYVAGLSYKITCTDDRGTAEITGRSDFSPVSAKEREADPLHGIVAPVYEADRPLSFYINTLSHMLDEDGVAAFFDWEFNKEVKEEGAEMNRMRDERNRLLKNSDWSQLSDVPDTIKQQYAVYRQALRDIPTQDGFPYNIDWPEQPEV